MLHLKKLFPFLLWLPFLDKKTLRLDMMAGLTGAVIVLPQGVAFAAIAGLPPEYGLYTAMVTPIIAAFFGSSFHLISGPTTAISIVVFSAISHHAEPGTPEFIQMALTLTFLAGVYQFAFGLARMGSLVNFVSHTVVIGFTAGAAVLIATSQMQHVLGVVIPRGESFVHVWMDLYSMLEQINPYVIAVALVTLVVAVLAKKLLPRSPNLLLGMIAGSLTSLGIDGAEHGVSLIGEIPAHLPPLSSPDFSLTAIRQLAPEAFAVALLGLIEAVSISRAIAARSHQRINANQEFIGQGASNVIASFFSCYAGSGSFTRSGVNYAAGARTPMSAVFAALFLMVIVLLVAPLTAYLPIASMGGVILLVAYGLVDIPHIRTVLRVSRSETAILLVTFFSTLFLELEFAIYLGVLVSLVVFLSRTSTPDILELAPDTERSSRKLENALAGKLKQCPQLRIIRIDMSIYFGSSNHIQERIYKITEDQGIRHILIIGSSINFVDLSGAEMLIQEASRVKSMGGNLYFCGLKGKVLNFMNKGEFIHHIGGENFFNHKHKAIDVVTSRLDHKICSGCSIRVFADCACLPGGEDYQTEPEG